MNHSPSLDAKPAWPVPFHALALEKREASSETGLGLVAGLLLILVFATMPVYLLPSGSLQVVDLFIVLLILVMACKLGPRSLASSMQVLYLLPFVIYAVALNTVYFAFNNHDLTYLKKAAEMLYVTSIIFTSAMVFSKMLLKGEFFPFFVGISLSVIVPFFIQGNYDIVWIRNALSFNNPNQLGYFTILVVSFMLLIKENLAARYALLQKMRYRFLVWFVISMAHVMALLSLSKTTLASIFLLDLYLLVRTPLKTTLPLIGGALLLLGSIFVFMPQYVNKYMDYIQTKANMDQLQERFNKNYYRIEFTDEWQWLVGAGIGKADPTIDDKEVHNIFGAILKAYGLIGILLSMLWFGRLMHLSLSLNGGVMVVLALLLYNSFHNGIRFRSFWILSGFIVILASSLAQSADLRDAPRAAVAPPRPHE
ncbi:MAG: hypothetical protein FJ128_08970 [Deltaproteobacteria bacterium]|nr:hypothetical protein [Deltaproteobacteria bacterium]MBM4287002.1 hypothetical protein [Deltaproteobacteria bacterium]